MEKDVEYDIKIRKLLDKSTYLEEFSTILPNFNTYQCEVKNILSENAIIDLSPSSEFVLMYLEETKYDSEQQWEDKVESLMEATPKQNKFIIKLKRLIIETLPIFLDSYKFMSENPLKNKEMNEEEYMNMYVHPVLKRALSHFSDIRYVLGNKAIKASVYRKNIMNQKGNADRADGMAYTLNQQKFL
ncbi:11086_t:CDS:2 [Entrophospora sp. SA101]|nr:11086_t:CDS:2 [Entrophospora sp. SA101]